MKNSLTLTMDVVVGDKRGQVILLKPVHQVSYIKLQSSMCLFLIIIIAEFLSSDICDSSLDELSSTALDSEDELDNYVPGGKQQKGSGRGQERGISATRRGRGRGRGCSKSGRGRGKGQRNRPRRGKEQDSGNSEQGSAFDGSKGLVFVDKDAWIKANPVACTYTYSNEPGPTSASVTPECTALDLFLRFFTQEAWDLVVKETNR